MGRKVGSSCCCSRSLERIEQENNPLGLGFAVHGRACILTDKALPAAVAQGHAR